MDIGYSEEREISFLRIAGGNGRVLFETQQAGKDIKQDSAPGLSQSQMNAFCAELKRTGVDMQAIRERYSIGGPGEMTQELYEKAMQALRRTKSVQAA